MFLDFRYTSNHRSTQESFPYKMDKEQIFEVVENGNSNFYKTVENYERKSSIANSDFKSDLVMLQRNKWKSAEPSFSTKIQHYNKVDEIVELVDLFPTIAELAEHPITTCSDTEGQKINPCSEGLSFLPLIKGIQCNPPKNFAKFISFEINQLFYYKMKN